MNTANYIVGCLLEDHEPGKFAACCVFKGLPDNPKVLLVLREGPPEAGKWSCPGGHVDKGEPVEDAAYRELEEETGVKAERLVHFTDRKHDDGVTGMFYGIVPDDTKAKAMDDAEKIKWCSVDQLPDLAFGNNELVPRAFRIAKRAAAAGS